jgi:hypothetical protein
LNKEARVLWIRAAYLIAIVIAAVAIFYVGISSAVSSEANRQESQSARVQSVVFSVIGAVTIVGLMVLGPAIDYARSRAARQDLKSGVVATYQFQGNPVDEDETVTKVFEVSHSGRLVTQDGELQPLPWERYPKPVQLSPTLVGRPGERRLSLSEVAEIRSALERMERRPLALYFLGFAVGLSIWSFIGIYVENLGWGKSTHLWIGVLPGVLAGTIVVHMATRNRYVAVLRNDLRYGRICEEDGMEYLAWSGVIWSKDGEPADWRKEPKV